VEDFIHYATYIQSGLFVGSPLFYDPGFFIQERRFIRPENRRFIRQESRRFIQSGFCVAPGSQAHENANRCSIEKNAERSHLENHHRP
jgi:hypothetical protein